MAKLTDKQIRFVEEYLVDLNATQAAIRAGYKEKNARAIGAENLTKPNIAEKIEKAMAERSARTEVTQDMVLKELAAVAFANGSDFARVVEKPLIDPLSGEPVLDRKTGKQKTYQDVEMVPTEVLSEDKRKAIANIKMGKNGIEVISCDKVKALELLGRHLGMFLDKVETTGSIAVEVIYDYGEED